MWEQYVDCSDDGRADWKGIPGPLHVMIPPSPVDQVTAIGVATAVALTDPTDAVTE
jgi:hypothetical protein